MFWIIFIFINWTEFILNTRTRLLCFTFLKDTAGAALKSRLRLSVPTDKNNRLRHRLRNTGIFTISQIIPILAKFYFFIWNFKNILMIKGDHFCLRVIWINKLNKCFLFYKLLKLGVREFVSCSDNATTCEGYCETLRHTQNFPFGFKVEFQHNI